MYPQYRKGVVNKQSLQHLTKSIFTPAESLGVGLDNYMGHYSMLVHHEHKLARVITPEPARMPIESLQPNLQNATISDKDFPDSPYFGDSLAGI